MNQAPKVGKMVSYGYFPCVDFMISTFYGPKGKMIEADVSSFDLIFIKNNLHHLKEL